MQVPSKVTRTLVDQRIARAELDAKNLSKDESVKKAVDVVRAVLFEHKPGIPAAFYALLHPRIDHALIGIADVPFLSTRFEFLRDSIHSMDLPERVDLFCLILELVRERPEEDEMFGFQVALGLVEHMLSFPDHTPEGSLSRVLQDALLNRMNRTGEYQEEFETFQDIARLFPAIAKR
jgi:hypothetical protein